MAKINGNGFRGWLPAIIVLVGVIAQFVAYKEKIVNLEKEVHAQEVVIEKHTERLLQGDLEDARFREIVVRIDKQLEAIIKKMERTQ